MKKNIKKLKKNLEIRKSRRIFVAVNKQHKNYKAMKQIVIDNAELLEVLEANGINIICSDDMRMMITDTDAIRIDTIVAEKAPAAFADYVIC